MQNSLPSGAKVLSIILYSDATTCDHLGKTSEHPIYLTLGNIINWCKNKPDAKILLGYLPQLKAKTISEKRTESFYLAKHAIYQYSLDILTRPLLDYRNDGFDLKTDLPENAAVTLTYNSVNCKYPCHKCLIENDELNNTRLNGDEIVLRTPENMKDYVDRGIANQYSLHNMKNIFWKHP